MGLFNPNPVDIHTSTTPPPEGSAIFMQNTVPWPLSSIIKRVTNSPWSHVAVLLYSNEIPYIFEAYPPCVRVISLRRYLEKTMPEWEQQFWTRRQGGLLPQWWEPKFIESDRLDRMRDKAISLLGTPYGLIWNWFWDTTAVHCSEFAGLVYEAGGLLRSSGHRDTPGLIYRKLLYWNSEGFRQRVRERP